jgi:hypothetical protein
MSMSEEYKKYLELEDFEEEIRQIVKEYTCSLCEGIYHHPTSDDCGHIFCRDCINPYFEKHKKCPISQNRLNKKNLKQVLFVQTMLNKYKIFCKNRNKNCEWTGTLSLLAQHLDEECEYQLVRCWQPECSATVPRNEHDSHMKSCPFRKVICTNGCDTAVSFNSLLMHLEECPKQTVLCPQNCQETITRQEITSHLSVCKMAPRDCQYKEVGCVERFPESKMTEHMKKNKDYHMTLLLNSFISLKQTFNQSCIPLSFNQSMTDFNLSLPLVDGPIKLDLDSQFIASPEAEKSLMKKRARSKSSDGKSMKKKSKENIPTLKRIFPCFDTINSSQGLEFKQDTVFCNISSRKKHFFAFGDTKIDDGTTFTIRLGRCEGWAAIGVCHKDKVICNEYAFSPRIKHQCYLISNNGYSWNFSNESQNNRPLEFSLSSNADIKVSYYSEKLTFTIGMTSFTLTQVSGDDLYPCCLMLKKGDYISLLNN